MKRRALSLVLALCLVLGMSMSLEVVSQAATNEQSIMNAVTNGGSITLENDVEMRQVINVAAGKDVTIDLNGHKLLLPYTDSVESGFLGNSPVTIYGSLTIKDSKSGGIIGEAIDIDGNEGNYNATIRVKQGGEFNLSGGTLHGEINQSIGIYEAVTVESSGVFNMAGGKISRFYIGLEGDGTFNLSGGTIEDIGSGAIYCYKDSMINISGDLKLLDWYMGTGRGIQVFKGGKINIGTLSKDAKLYIEANGLEIGESRVVANSIPESYLGNQVICGNYTGNGRKCVMENKDGSLYITDITGGNEKPDKNNNNNRPPSDTNQSGTTTPDKKPDTPAPSNPEGSNNVVRFYNPDTGDHIITSNPKEHALLKNNGWKEEGVSFVADNEGKTVYRLYNAQYGDHIFTTSEDEAQRIVSVGWVLEGAAFKVSGSKPVYRLYNTIIGKHHFTQNVAERDFVLSNPGWKLEGVAFYVN